MSLRERLFPRGARDFAWQLVLIALVYMVWRYIRGAVDGDPGAPFDHAWDLIAVERALHSFVELDVQRWAVATGWVADAASWLYANAHFKGSVAALLVIYFAHRSSYCFVRNMLIVAMGLSLLGYALYPTAPPRLLDDLGFDPAPAVTGQDPTPLSDPLSNPYAAVPSMHVGFALILALSLARLTARWALRAPLCLYPLLVTFVVVATGNHFWLDAVAGALVAAVSCAVAVAMGRVRPEWSFRGERDPGEAAAPVAPEAATA